MPTPRRVVSGMRPTGKMHLGHFHGALRGLLQLDPSADLQPGSERLLVRLEEWQAAAYRHGEQLGLRFFSHVGEASTQTFAT